VCKWEWVEWCGWWWCTCPKRRRLKLAHSLKRRRFFGLLGARTEVVWPCPGPGVVRVRVCVCGQKQASPCCAILVAPSDECGARGDAVCTSACERRLEASAPRRLDFRLLGAAVRRAVPFFCSRDAWPVRSAAVGAWPIASCGVMPKTGLALERPHDNARAGLGRYLWAWGRPVGHWLLGCTVCGCAVCVSCVWAVQCAGVLSVCLVRESETNGTLKPSIGHRNLLFRLKKPCTPVL
jgi:hypothetical protein